MGERIFGKGEFATIYDKIEEEASKALETIKPGDSLHELTDEEAERMSRVMDYKYRAQEQLETSFLYLDKINKV